MGESVLQLYGRESPVAKCNEFTGRPSSAPPDGTFQGTDSKLGSAVLPNATAIDPHYTVVVGNRTADPRDVRPKC